MGNYTPIRYDKKGRKGWIIRLAISGAIIALFIILLLIESLFLFSDALLIVFAVFSAALYIAIPFFVISVVVLIDSSVYLARLRKNYFEVPEDKNLFDRDLAKLPRFGQVENVYARDSKIGALLSIICYIVFVTVDICYVVKWTRLGESDSVFLFVVMMLFHLISSGIV